MKAYKLFRLKKDGNITSLFINKTENLKFNKWLKGKCYPTDGFKVRPGWHCTEKPEAPHLSKNGRIWCEVEIENFEEIQRPQNQGGKWFIANDLKILSKINE